MQLHKPDAVTRERALPAIYQGSCRIDEDNFSTRGSIYAAFWTALSLLLFGGFNQT